MNIDSFWLSLVSKYSTIYYRKRWSTVIVTILHVLSKWIVIFAMSYGQYQN